ncbi:MAG: hypothetical protein CSA62_09005 [Planctomycetota bacterium]|nr:MAG: hypothetical protein CSA62_09005 [Planctomycetota bacterium]
MRMLRFGAAAATAAVLLFACGGEKPKGSGGQPKKPAAPAYKVQHDEAALAKAKEVYSKICFFCHGKTGKGDGSGGVALKPRPTSFTTAAFHKRLEQKGGLAYVKKVILKGGQGVGLSAGMPAHSIETYPTLKDEKVLTELAKYVVYDLGKYPKKLK